MKGEGFISCEKQKQNSSDTKQLEIYSRIRTLFKAMTIILVSRSCLFYAGCDDWSSWKLHKYKCGIKCVYTIQWKGVQRGSMDGCGVTQCSAPACQARVRFPSGSPPSASAGVIYYQEQGSSKTGHPADEEFHEGAILWGVTPIHKNK
jgi:hypothetical protein